MTLAEGGEASEFQVVLKFTPSEVKPAAEQVAPAEPVVAAEEPKMEMTKQSEDKYAVPADNDEEPEDEGEGDDDERGEGD